VSKPHCGGDDRNWRAGRAEASGDELPMRLVAAVGEVLWSCGQLAPNIDLKTGTHLAAKAIAGSDRQPGKKPSPQTS